MTETYNILFSLGFRHNYYKDGFCPAFSVRPDGFTAALFKKNGFIFRETKAGFVVLVRSEKDNNDLFLSGTVDNRLQGNFLLTLRNPGILNITETNEPDLNSIRLYSNNSITADDENVNTYHFNLGNIAYPATDFFKVEKDLGSGNVFEKNGIQVSLDPVEKNDSIMFGTTGLDHGLYRYSAKDGQLNYYLTSSSLELKPFALISIDLDHLSVIDMDGKMLKPGYILRYETRRTYWQYYLLNLKQGTENLVIGSSSSEGVEEFDRSDEVIQGNRPVIVFTSKQPIPITESREDYFRLQSRNGDPSNDLILISRLPIPTIDVLNRTIDGKTYTPIFVNY